MPPEQRDPGGPSAAADPGDGGRDPGRSCRRSSTSCTRKVGRPSIPPEKLLRALLLQVLYTVRSERLLMEQLDYNLLFRWFVGLNMDDPIWDATVFTKNRERLLARGRRPGLLRAGPAQAGARPAVRRALHGRRHADRGLGRLKSFKRKDAPPDAAGRSGQPDGELSRRAAQQRDPRLDDRSRRAAGPQGHGQRGQALLPGPRADGQPPRPGRRRLRDAGQRLRRARGRAGDGRAAGDDAPGHPRRRQGLRHAATSSRPCGCSQVTPHVAQNTSNRSSAIDGRTTRHAGYG